MLIVEGTDLLGKTTLCKKLAKALEHEGYVYKHFSRLPCGFNYVGGYIQNAVERSVQDRFHMSEIAYAWARGEESSPLDSLCYRLVDAYLRSIGAFTVIIVTGPVLLAERYRTHGDDMYDLHTIQRANEVFCQIALNHEFDWGDEHYRCIDHDAVLHMTEENPWPSDHDLENVLLVYRRKMAHLAAIRDRCSTRRLPFLGRC